MAVESGEYVLISTYCSPNVERREFEKLLRDIGNCIGNVKGKKVIIGGGRI